MSIDYLLWNKNSHEFAALSFSDLNQLSDKDPVRVANICNANKLILSDGKTNLYVYGSKGKVFGFYKEGLSNVDQIISFLEGRFDFEAVEEGSEKYFEIMDAEEDVEETAD